MPATEASRDDAGLQDLAPSVWAAVGQIAATEPITVRISGGCMSPAIPDGARVRVARRRHYWPGDVLVFAAAGGRLTAHRLVGGCRWRGRFRLFTRADNAARLDGAILVSQVLGLVVGGECHRDIAKVPLTQRLRSFLLFSRAALARLTAMAVPSPRNLPEGEGELDPAPDAAVTAMSRRRVP
jgi:hypothetical protein